MVTNFQGDKPTVSVIMNCLNCEKYLREAIDSMYAQTYTEWEIIFWDNASTDGSAGIAKSYDSRLRYFKGEMTIPLGSARNKALEQCQGEFIAFLDCDDLWLPEKLEKQIPFFWTDPEIGIVICDSIFFDKKMNEKQLYSNNKPPTGRVFRELLGQYYISLETAVAKKSVIDQVGWFDKRFNLIEEMDLFVRMSNISKVEYVDEVLAKCRIHRESVTWQNENISEWPREKRMLLEKFNQLFPDFKKKYHIEINKLELEISTQEAMLAWKEQKKKKMRQYLRPYAKGNFKFKCKILLSYLISFETYLRLLKLYRRLLNKQQPINLIESG